jgi:uncharacterized metal-binding protein (TIGR02443 family)
VKRPRFIAGAVCPSCGAMDRLQVVGEGDARRRRCVSCGHEDALTAAASPTPRSRLDGALKPAADSAAGTVRILDVTGPRPGADRDESASRRDED